MGAFVNQHSFLLATALVLAVAGWLTWRRRVAVRLGVLAGVLALAAVAFALLRTPAGAVREVADLDGALGAGRPVGLELYSNY
jgi:hypothetical protein